jgi:hypothetical protein
MTTHQDDGFGHRLNAVGLLFAVGDLERHIDNVQLSELQKPAKAHDYSRFV